MKVGDFGLVTGSIFTGSQSSLIGIIYSTCIHMQCTCMCVNAKHRHMVHGHESCVKSINQESRFLKS